MKVLIVVHGYPPAAIGGTELYAEAHARTLHREHRDQVTVLTREDDREREDGSVRSEDRDGIRIVFINNTYRHARSFADTYASERIGAAAAAILDDVRPDVAHIHHLTHLSTTIVDSLVRRGIRSCMTLHDYWLICHRGQLLDINYRVCDQPASSDAAGCGSCVGLAGGVGATAFAGATVVRTLERRLPTAAAKGLRRAAESIAAMTARSDATNGESTRRLAHMRRLCDGISHFFAPSSFLRDRFIRFGVSSDRITLSPYGLDHQLFRRPAPPARTPGVVRLGFFGSLMRSKAPHLLLEAAAQLPPGTVSVDLFGAMTPYHGDDSYRAVLEPLTERPGVRVHGPLAHARVAEALSSVDAVVVPSIWPENSPFVIHEALLAGVPVVASRIGGIPEIVEHGRNGLLFEPGNASDLSRQLARLAAEAGLLDALRRHTPNVRTIADDVSRIRERYTERRDAAPASLAAIVLNFQTPDETLLAVKALQQSDRPIDHVIVVNNGPAGEPGAMHAAFTDMSSPVTVLHTGSNLGFSGGMNAGIRAAIARGADRVLLVNSDVIVPPDCIGHLEDALASAPCAGIVGPVMMARTDPGTIASLGIAYSQATGRMRHQEFGTRLEAMAVATVQEVDAVSGCVMLITRDVVDAIGSLDEAYFFSFEDVDFCLRAKRAGFSSVIAGGARVYHEGHRSIGHATPARLYFAARNHLRLAHRINGASMPFGLWAAPIVAYNLAHAIRANGGSLPSRLGAVARGTRDYALGRFGAGAESRRLTR